MLAAWAYCGIQLWAVLVTLLEIAHSTEAYEGEPAVELNEEEEMILQGEECGRVNHCLGKVKQWFSGRDSPCLLLC